MPNPLQNVLLRGLIVASIAFCLCSRAKAQFPGLDDDDLQKLIDEAAGNVGISGNDYCIRLWDRTNATVPAVTEDCARYNNPESDCHQKYRIHLYPYTMRAVYKVPPEQAGDFSWMTGDFRGMVLGTLMHEMFHACLAANGLACPQGNDQRNCIEYYIDHNLALLICNKVTGYCQVLCGIMSTCDPNDPACQEEVARLRAYIRGLCQMLDDMAEYYNDEGWAEHWCRCQMGDYGGPYPPPGTTGCSVIMPPVPPGGGEGGDPCNYPDGGPVEMIPPCSDCNCACPIEWEEQ